MGELIRLLLNVEHYKYTHLLYNYKISQKKKLHTFHSEVELIFYQ